MIVIYSKIALFVDYTNHLIIIAGSDIERHCMHRTLIP